MTEQPDPTKELDLSELSELSDDPGNQLDEGEAPHRDDVVEGEPGWESDDAEATPVPDER